MHLRFDYPQDPDEPEQITPATLSEPIHAVQDSEDDPSTDDPYHVMAQALDSRKYEFTGTRDDGSPDERRYTDTYKLDSAYDDPFDSFSSYSPLALSDPFLTKDKINGSNRPLLMLNGTHTNFAVVHLQRLANPKAEYDSDENPYVTVDSMTVDLTVVNTDSGRQNVYDESGRTGSASQPEITWLQENQRKYRFESVERGGKAPSNIIAASSVL